MEHPIECLLIGLIQISGKVYSVLDTFMDSSCSEELTIEHRLYRQKHEGKREEMRLASGNIAGQRQSQELNPGTMICRPVP